LAGKTELSESFLSQVERGRANPSIASLQRVVAAMGKTMADLWVSDGSARPSILRAHQRPALAFGILGTKYFLTPRPCENLEVFVADLAIGGSTGEQPITHGDSEELFLVLGGKVHLQVGQDIFDLKPRDSVRYRSSTPHGVVNVGLEVAEVMWVISPPSY